MLLGSRVVYVRRDPRDVALSCFKNNLTWPFSDLDAIGDYLAACERLMKHAANVLPIAMHTVEYETLIADPEAESRRLIEFCGLSWNEACLQPPSGDRSVRTPSKSQVRRPFYQSSVGAWQRYESFLRKHAGWID